MVVRVTSSSNSCCLKNNSYIEISGKKKKRFHFCSLSNVRVVVRSQGVPTTPISLSLTLFRVFCPGFDVIWLCWTPFLHVLIHCYIVLWRQKFWILPKTTCYFVGRKKVSFHPLFWLSLICEMEYSRKQPCGRKPAGFHVLNSKCMSKWSDDREYKSCTQNSPRFWWSQEGNRSPLGKADGSCNGKKTLLAFFLMWIKVLMTVIVQRFIAVCRRGKFKVLLWPKQCPGRRGQEGKISLCHVVF